MDDGSAIRKELEDYLLYISQKTGSDGLPLVVLPDNFEKITESMTKDDLFSNSEELWCNRLFQDNIDNVLRDEFDGRYSSYLAETPEVKISHGLAQIQLLDRQLQDIARRQIRLSSNDGKDSDTTFLTRRIESDVDNIIGLAQESTKSEPQIKINNFNNQQELRLQQLLSLNDEEFCAQDDYLECMRDLAVQNVRIDTELKQYGNTHLLAIPEGDECQQLGCLADQVRLGLYIGHCSYVDLVLTQDPAAKGEDNQ